MGVPKRKTSKSRVRTRKAAHKRPVPSTIPCPKCGMAHRPHRVCPSCGYYRGRQVVATEVD